jgi:uncharacterized protein (DUF934 family)
MVTPLDRWATSAGGLAVRTADDDDVSAIVDPMEGIVAAMVAITTPGS